MQESRLFRIVYYLLQNGKATAPGLAQKFEVSIRTIYRDIDSISNAGIPIYATQGKGEVFLSLMVIRWINLCFLNKNRNKC